MYREYFGLQEKPFTISPDPRYLYMSEHHREALAHLLYGINSDGCLILLTGDVGTGKTTVCRSLIQQLPHNTEAAIIVNPKLSVQELLETICEELQIPFTRHNPTIKSYIDAINHSLLTAHAQGRTTLLIIDEAQNLDMEVLEQLRLLTNLETDTTKLLKIILIGQPELQQKLEQPEVAQINQRITSRYHLAPLSENDASQFIRHRLIIAGGGRMEFFSPAALKDVYRASRGIPRLINIICDRALLGAYVENANQVNRQIVAKAAKEVLGVDFTPEKSSKKPFIILLCISLAASITFFFMFSQEKAPPGKTTNADTPESAIVQEKPEDPSPSKAQ